MQCPKCKHLDSKVLESRPTQEDQAIRRRRECLSCGFRFSTYEQVEILDLTVVKRDGRREPYSFEKMHGGILKAFEKIDISEKELKRFSETIERDIQNKAKNGEIRSSDIGAVVVKKLKRKDPVAYLRFASVYLQFQDIGDFKDAISVFPNYKVASKKKLINN
jgi:transcriptional repressor NrdR